MPADKYSYATTNGEFKGVRTFALEVRHVASANYEFASVILGEKNPVEMGSEENGSDNLKSKDEIVKYLKDSFVYLHKAMDSLNEQNLVTPMKSPGERIQLRGCKSLFWQRRILSITMARWWNTLRANSIVPPASRR